MDIDNLTNDSKFLLSSLYKRYIVQRKNNIDKQKAIYFNNSDTIKEQIMPERSTSDVFSCIRELSTNGFITCTYLSNKAFDVRLTDKSISAFEHKFKNNLSSLIEFISAIKSLIPFI